MNYHRGFHCRAGEAMNKKFLRVTVLFLISIIYFSAFIPPNLTGAENEHMLFLTSQDESFQFPFLKRMLTPGKDIHETRSNWISYGHYIYGYPFYLYSAILILPFRWLHGIQVLSQTKWILLILRQFVSVLPMIIAIVILVVAQTRSHNTLLSCILFIFLLTTPGVVRNNICWWHPDALSLLSVVLTLVFLYKDDQQFGWYFFLAAVSCGFSFAIKTVGCFFVFTIAAYLLSAMLLRKISLTKGIIYALMFIMIMFSVTIVSNPLLLKTPQRNRIIEVHLEHHYYFTHGWLDGEPYSTGLKPWIPVFNKWYGKPFFILFSLVSMLIGSLIGKNKNLNRLITSWVLPYSVYVIFAIAVKPDHYWLPVMIPMFSSILSLYRRNSNLFSIRNQNMSAFVNRLVNIMIFVIITIQFVLNLSMDYQLFKNTLG